jgi:4-oxalomesaconate tautomerase
VRQEADQYAIPCVFMRGGTSKGPFFHAHDLPPQGPTRDKLLLRLMGALEPRRIDGLGGVDSLTNKIAIISKSSRPGIDVDYLFGQICVHKNTIDYSVNCGNMLAAVGPFSIDTGLVQGGDGETIVRIHNVNTGKDIHATVRTANGKTVYGGDARIDGVAGSAAPVWLDFKAIEGAKTGKLLPTGRARDVIRGLSVSCVDAAVPMVIAYASDFGLTGHESAQEINQNESLLKDLEQLRQDGGRLMGLGDVAKLEMPKLTLVAPPRTPQGNLAARYLMPYTCHTALAVTGAVCLGAAVNIPGSVARDVARPHDVPSDLVIEHPSGQLSVSVTTRRRDDGTIVVESARLLRTARRLMSGSVYVPIGFEDQVPGA